MRNFLHELRDFTKKGDWVLLILCLITSAFGCASIALSMELKSPWVSESTKIRIKTPF